MKYLLVIKSRSGATRLYWNRITQTWNEYRSSASPFTEQEILMLLSNSSGMILKAYGVEAEEVKDLW